MLPNMIIPHLLSVTNHDEFLQLALSIPGKIDLVEIYSDDMEATEIDAWLSRNKEWLADIIRVTDRVCGSFVGICIGETFSWGIVKTDISWDSYANLGASNNG